MERHDMVHSYSSAFIPLLAELDVPTLSTLNSYVPVCPKGDMMYHGEEKCSGPSPTKCASCIATTAVKRRQGVERELRASYSSLGKIDLVQKSMKRAGDIDAYHALSPHLKEDYDALGFPGDRTTVIPHFYDEAFHREKPDPSAGVDDADGDPVTLLYVGALQDIKGLHVLIPGLAEMRNRGHDVELEIVGAGPYEARLKELADEEGVADAIDWLGYVDHGDLPDVYDEADAFVYPGLIDEPFGRVVLEALSMRTPLLVSDVGSMDFIVGDAGEPFEAGNPSALADAFERLVADYDAYYAAIDEELPRFAPETVIGKYSELYREVAATKRVVTR
jgi:glycosyltransferase involved in cell wall biosynthesis